MPRVLDNIQSPFLPALTAGLERASRADFCVGYFNLRGWAGVDARVEAFAGGEGACARVLIGMQRPPQRLLRDALRVGAPPGPMDNATAARLCQEATADFRDQLQTGAPTAADEAALRRLAGQLRDGKVVVKLFLRHPLHAKLYLLHRDDPAAPTVALLGSSNLTFSGLGGQGELNVELTDRATCDTLAAWFDARWADRYCLDITADLARLIDQSWAAEHGPTPFEVYLKIAHELSRDARAGLREFTIPADFRDTLFEFQEKAVKMAAKKLNARGGVIIGDVVGLGKTLMATALARVMEDDQGLETLVLCPKNLVPMWEDYAHRYRLRGRVMSVSAMTPDALNRLPAHRLVIVDESHNLRNREAKRHALIRGYIERSSSRVILLSATPYNKAYLDLGSQLRLFTAEDADLGMRPERLIRSIGLVEFKRRHNAPERSLAAFEKSDFADDWRDLMRLFLVRRTRGFIKNIYGKTDEHGRAYLEMRDGGRSYFPTRVPRTVKVASRKTDAYAKLYGDGAVAAINALALPRYGLAAYLDPAAPDPAAPDPAAARQAAVAADLSRAGRRLMGFCRTNLFKRLESGGHAFYQSVQRHILRNHVTLHALEGGLDVPVGTQDVRRLDPDQTDADELFDAAGVGASLADEAEYRRLAAATYAAYAADHAGRFGWLPAAAFTADLARDLLDDANRLADLLRSAGPWEPSRDRKLAALEKLLAADHPAEKVVVFTQFADTARYLARELRRRGIENLAGVTGASTHVVDLVRRFSPSTNGAADLAGTDRELRVLIATDVLSEGQNLQDAHVLVNFDLPWAIIRLIQRAGRIDRIGQQAAETVVHSFLPADGIERVIRLRQRVGQRLRDSADVLGSDEQFFDDDRDRRRLLDIYHERAGSLDDDDADAEVDLESEAYEIWKGAVDRYPALAARAADLPGGALATKAAEPLGSRAGDGVLAYARDAADADHLAWVDAAGEVVTESQIEILRAAACAPDAPGLPRLDAHHDLVRRAAARAAEVRAAGGALGERRSVKFRLYERLADFARAAEGTLFDAAPLKAAVDELARRPLTARARDAVGRQLRAAIRDADLVQLALDLHADNALCVPDDADADGPDGPRVICSLGLRADR